MKYKNSRALRYLVCLIWVFLLSLSVFTSESINCINVNDVKNLIKVPMIRQGTNYTCGAVALQSVLLYYYRNEREYQWLCEDSLIKELGVTTDNGTTYGQIVKTAKKRGLNAEVQSSMSIKSIKETIDQKKLVICDIQAWADKPPVDYKKSYDEGHYVVAIGYDEENIYFMDPWTVGNYTYISIEELLARWHDTNIDDSGQIVKTENLGIVLWRNSKPEFDSNIITKIE